jgi:hypothetical protein
MREPGGINESGGDARIRTEDLFHAMEALYQLSYIPTVMSDKSLKIHLIPWI